MIKVGFVHQVLAYLAMAVSLVSLILAGVSRLLARPVGFQLTSYMFIAGMAMLFAIYFFAGAIFFRDKQVRWPLTAEARKGPKVEPSPSISEHRVFSILGNNKGLYCPFRPGICQNGYCEDCQIYLDWQKLGELVVVCAYCGKEVAKESGSGRSGVSIAMCPKCWHLFWTDQLK